MTDVLLVVPSLGVGGSERQVVMLAIGLQSRGLDVAVAVLAGRGRWSERLRQAGVQVAHLGLSGVTDPRVMLRLLVLMRRLRPRVVHAFLHGFDALAELPARLLSVPLVLGSRRELAVWMEDRHVFMQRLGAEQADYVVCNADAVRRDALRREGGDPGRYVVIHNGVDVEYFRGSTELRGSRQRAERTVVTLANFGAEKGHATLLEAASRVVSREPAARFVLAGEGPLRAEIEATAASLVSSGRCLFPGHVEDVRALLATADLFVLPSLREGFPNALLEAMAAGVACVASDVGGISEAIVNGRDGVLVPAGDPHALANAIVALLADDKRRSKLAAAGQERVAAEFGRAGVIGRFHQLYARGLEGT